VSRLAVLALMIVAACSGRAATSESTPTPPRGAAVLAALAGQKAIVMPTQGLRELDSLGWAAKVGGTRAFLAKFDSVVTDTLRERNLTPMWTFPAELSRLARRNPLHATDPANIRAGDAVRALERRSDRPLVEPVASQLRTLSAFVDARYAVIPSELRFESGPGGGRAVLHVAVLDLRAASLVWSGDVVSDPFGDYSPQVAPNVAARFATLLSPP
jgi:hypothetical protein